MSAESGIPTYRGEGGLWRRVDFEKLATREAFEADPLGVWSWYVGRRHAVRAASPNAAHVAVTRIAAAIPEALVITQNVDDLHERAGLPRELLVHVHGTILDSRCLACDTVTAARDDDPTRRCAACGKGGLRPNVVWFDEELPPAEVSRVEGFFDGGTCGLVVVVGTTASFDYVRAWVRRAAANGGLVLDVNPEHSAILDELPGQAIHLRARAGDVLPAVARLIAEPPSSPPDEESNDCADDR